MNKKIKIFLLVSSVERSGPSLGALAMLKLLEKNKNKYDVKLISRFKKDANFLLDEKNIVYTNNYFKTFIILLKNKNNKNFVCLSYDIKMDFINVLSVKKSLIYIRANNLDNYSTTFGDIFGNILYNFHNILLKFCSGIFVLTNTQKKIFQNSDFNFVKKTHVLPNFIDEVPLRPFKKKKNSFLIIGSFIERKRIYESLKAFLTSFRNDENYSLTIIGNGNQNAKINSLISQNHKCSVRIINELVNPLVFFEESEFFILMSDSEGLSRASLEASYFNCKLILSNIDVHNEFFSDYALIVNSFSELSDKLTLISNEQILLNPGFPFSCKSVNIEQKFNLFLNNFLS